MSDISKAGKAQKGTQKKVKSGANEMLVLDALLSHETPLGAYQLLDRLRDAGLKAPPQIYRALDQLVSRGLVHKLESLNAFVACRQQSVQSGNHTCTFTICGDCHAVSELCNTSLERELHRVTETQEFDLKSATIELHGSCRNCAGV